MILRISKPDAAETSRERAEPVVLRRCVIGRGKSSSLKPENESIGHQTIEGKLNPDIPRANNKAKSLEMSFTPPTRLLLRATRSRTCPVSSSFRSHSRRIPSCPKPHIYTSTSPNPFIRPIHTSPLIHQDFQPSQSSPPKPNPATISIDTYHALADAYVDSLVLALEEKIESGETGEPGWEVDHSVSSDPIPIYSAQELLCA